MYYYTCCSKSDIEQTLEPGQNFNLHWLTEHGARDLPTRYVTLSATLIGPYRDPFSGVADGELRTVSAPYITADTWEAQEPVSSVLLPTDLPSGLFQLRARVLIAIDSESNSESLGTMSESVGVIRVGRGFGRTP
jgi:hypothetical protein